MSTAFVKMHGCGNDFVILDERAGSRALSPEQAAFLANRHTGIGCDQVIAIQPCSTADAFMRIWNPDGSEAGACGNATRCVADILMREAGREAVTIRTVSGDLHAIRGADGLITVDMGPPRLDWADVPLAEPMDTLRLGLPGEPAAASMGNPHATFFVPDLDAVPIGRLGPEMEHHPIFPQRANIGFAHIINPETIRLKVWERGAGLTLACGSGACATLVNAHRRGLAQRRAQVIVDGGTLTIAWRDDGHVLMTGPAVTAFHGEIALPKVPLAKVPLAKVPAA
ncbi:diaminopimelate epimerase [Rhodopila globiformis]|uniref:Diaminopimelate epimerase n=1 Tax=Rhodopila globiformis TaxID=1071 RepID=A0A2S6N9Q1_RHOGL|nr:diaminopimelate epimerase [Rhodopila globiformis]PPQ31343.1 diaminopimelate epimerase [Rhodopila globiformis]